MYRKIIVQSYENYATTSKIISKAQRHGEERF